MENYEKKYKDALERAKKYWNSPRTCVDVDVIPEIFPELAESEDEKIRKTIHIYLDWLDGRKDYAPRGEYSIRDMIAWLEKQGEQKPYGQRQECIDCQFNYAGECKGSCAMKRSEQKPTDKVEPKFKVGDWVANDYCVGKVIALTDDAYLLDSGQGIPFSCEHNAHLWTIQDAKDGDVLCCESGWTCIFKTLNSDNISFSSYCFMDNTGWFCETGSESHTLEKAFIKAYNGNIYPATKEQRDLLFSKMKESGYEWDAEKKELKLLITNGGDFESETCKQKPTVWSEEDEKIIKRIDSLLYSQCKIHGSEYEEIHNWLKSLRPQS